MSPTRTTSARDFQLRLSITTAVAAIATVALISLYLTALIRLPGELWRGFAEIVGGAFVVLFVVSTWANLRAIAPIMEHLRLAETGSDSRETRAAAFATLSRLPFGQFLVGLFWWPVGGVIVAAGMSLRFESFTLFSAVEMVIAAASGGFVTTTFLYFVHKRVFGGLLLELAAGIPEPEERAALVSDVPMRHKLLVAVTGVTFMMVSFAMCLAYVVAERRVEASVTGVQARLLDGASAAAAVGVLPGLREQARELEIAADVIVVDVRRGEVVDGPAGLLLPAELGVLLASPVEGRSLGFDSPNHFAWRRIDADHVVAAVLPAAPIASSLRWIFLLMLGSSGVISFGLSRMLAGDLGTTTERISRAVERMAQGDLRPGEVLESDDELGSLARSFERMSRSVRETVGSVAGAADRVEAAAAEIAGSAAGVATGASEQGRGVQRAGERMEAIQQQITGIAESATELNVLVEESSSSILEMGAAGDELNDTAGVLSSKIDEVSSSIEEMVRSVKQVATNTDALSDAASETSSSMEEMASAMRQVDATAAQTADLSRAVVQSAENGQDKVRRTIEGMESIRSATETAERVIRGLGERAVEIGAILDVIDDVADETNLLALNAAIIAAQAGEHGRAFSVVADEIKELADRVLASTKEIGGLISSVQEESSNAVGAIEEGSRSVASGVQLSMEAGQSLEEITRSSRDSGGRMQEIVQAVREQTKAAGHVVELMERVSSGVGAIQRATSEQDRGNEVVYRSAVAMREVALQLRGTTEEQARGGARIRESIEGVRDSVESINQAIQSQSEANTDLARFLEQVSSRASANDESARRMEQATGELTSQSEGLHGEVRKFQI